jgi:hypothetical protein
VEGFINGLKVGSTSDRSLQIEKLVRDDTDGFGAGFVASACKRDKNGLGGRRMTS